MARALAAAIVLGLLAVSGAGGAPAQTPKRGGTVVVPGVFAGTREPACLNTFRKCGELALAHVEEVLEGAFEVGPDRVRPNLVSHVERTRKPPFTLTYHIRPEARWSDGVPVTARDLVFTHQATRRADLAAGLDTLHATSVRSVRATGPKTVRVVLEERRNDWRSRLFGVVLPRHAVTDEILDGAVRAVARHPLRALDAVQLASALAARAVDPSVTTFACFDTVLADAARAERFSTL